MAIHAVRITEEGGGFVATCTCKWVRFEQVRTVLAAAIHAHKPRKVAD